jgi:UDP-N-acetylmuramyl pentapeptide synthase
VGLINVELAVTGVHNVRNALAATACAIGAGIDHGAIAEGLRSFSPVAGRGVRLQTTEGGLLIDDTYNANPDSVRAAIDLLATFEGERALVLGDMGEVGERGPEFHREVGAYARERGIEALFTLGAMGREAVDAFGPGARHAADIDALLAALRPCLGPAVTVLVKGSRFMRMERVVQAIAAKPPEGVH